MKEIFNTVRRAGPCLGEHDPAIELTVFERLLNINNQNEKNISHREKIWAVIGDVGMHCPAIELIVFKSLLNINNQNER